MAMEHSFVYSIDWVEFVFSSRTVAEELLLPEREAGHLTSADYDKAINFLPKAKQHAYRPMGGLLLFSLATYLGIRYRRPKWTTFQAAGVIACLGFAGFTLGKLNMVKTHVRFLNSIENPRGFSNAMRNIESRTGLQIHLTRGLKFTTVLGNENEKGTSHKQATSIVVPGSSITKPEDPSKQTEKALSRWDEIRMANSRPITPSSWDALMQKNAKNENAQIRNQQPPSPFFDQAEQGVDQFGDFPSNRR